MFAQCCRAASVIIDYKRRTLKFNIAVIHHHYFGGKLSMNCSLRNVIQCAAYVNFCLLFLKVEVIQIVHRVSMTTLFLTKRATWECVPLFVLKA